MKYKVGDRVKFLTESGGGIIRKIVGPNLVNVETEDGFEIPTLTRDLIIVEAKTVAERLFMEPMDEAGDNAFSQKEEEQTDTSTDDYLQASSNLIVYPSDRKAENYHFSIAFVPQMQNMPLLGELDVYMMNFSNKDVLFSYHHQQKGAYDLVASARVDAFTKYFVASIKREELESYINAQVQVLILQHQSKELLSPISSDMQLRGSKFYKESSYKEDAFIHQKALIYRFFKFTNIPVINQLSLEKDTEVHKTNAKEIRLNEAILKHQTKEGEAVVDMHIWELVDNHSRMTNAEILNVQLGYFEKCLQSAIDHSFHKVVFIHGVGTGKLKEEIKQLLDEKDFIKYRPASMAEYGVGATLVEL